MMRQYLAIKREVPVGAIVMFRLGEGLRDAFDPRQESRLE